MACSASQETNHYCSGGGIASVVVCADSLSSAVSISVTPKNCTLQLTVALERYNPNALPGDPKWYQVGSVQSVASAKPGVKATFNFPVAKSSKSYRGRVLIATKNHYSPTITH